MCFRCHLLLFLFRLLVEKGKMVELILVSVPVLGDELAHSVYLGLEGTLLYLLDLFLKVELV